MSNKPKKDDDAEAKAGDAVKKRRVILERENDRHKTTKMTKTKVFRMREKSNTGLQDSRGRREEKERKGG